MYRLSRLRFLFPLGLFICFFLNGSLSKIFANQFFSYPYLMVSQLVVLWLIFGAFFEEDIQIPLTGFAVAAGICADLYYSGILGLFMFLYPAIVMFARALNRYYTPSFLSHILIFFVSIALLELLNYWAYYLVGVTRVGFAGFLLDTLGPTLALNLVYFILLYWPVHRLYQRALGEQH